MNMNVNMNLNMNKFVIILVSPTLAPLANGNDADEEAWAATDCVCVCVCVCDWSSESLCALQRPRRIAVQSLTLCLRRCVVHSTQHENTVRNENRHKLYTVCKGGR